VGLAQIAQKKVKISAKGAYVKATTATSPNEVAGRRHGKPVVDSDCGTKVRVEKSMR
jgi:predicted proteasome-type protease